MLRFTAASSHDRVMRSLRSSQQGRSRGVLETTSSSLSHSHHSLPLRVGRNKTTILGLCAFGVVGYFVTKGRSSSTLSNTFTNNPTLKMALETEARSGDLVVATWNIAAVNNNPFEYWITYDEDPNYTALMAGVEKFLENPGTKDVAVKEVFTPTMFDRLKGKMGEVGWPKENIDTVDNFWKTDFQSRKIVSGFMKDGTLGSKRLASMPDRVTNTINTVGQVSSEASCGYEQLCRPTVINMYEGDLSTQDKWFEQWMNFMFEISVTTQSGETTETKKVYEMLEPIRSAKYPAITAEEEAVSVELQTLCQAIFDAILVHMMNDLAPDTWQPLKAELVEKLNKKKVSRTIEILHTAYAESDVILLQEVAAVFIETARKSDIGKAFYVAAPKALDGKRDQNSVILLKKSTFPDGPEIELTDSVFSEFEPGAKVPVAPGDIFAITATDAKGKPYLLASFHGDTNGMATIPVTKAIAKASSAPALLKHTLIFGLDANTYEPRPNLDPKKWQSVVEFGHAYVGNGLTSCFGDTPRPDYYTTFNARTFLQPQLNKACRSTEKRECGDVNPKDFILFRPSQLETRKFWKDNTGKREYIEGVVFPTLDFPSDHGILAAVLAPLI